MSNFKKMHAKYSFSDRTDVSKASENQVCIQRLFKTGGLLFLICCTSKLLATFYICFLLIPWVFRTERLWVSSYVDWVPLWGVNCCSWVSLWSGWSLCWSEVSGRSGPCSAQTHSSTSRTLSSLGLKCLPVESLHCAVSSDMTTRLSKQHKQQFKNDQLQSRYFESHALATHA